LRKGHIPAFNCDGFAAQERMVPGFTGWLLAIFANYPRTTQRVIAVSEYVRTRPE
jgi:hypothetical protein